MLAVGLGTAVYCWNAVTGSIEQLFESRSDDDKICSVSWMPDGTHLAVGMTSKVTKIWNVEQKKVR